MYILVEQGRNRCPLSKSLFLSLMRETLLFFEKKAKAAGKKAFFDDAPKKSPDGDRR